MVHSPPPRPLFMLIISVYPYHTTCLHQTGRQPEQKQSLMSKQETARPTPEQTPEHTHTPADIPAGVSEPTDHTQTVAKTETSQHALVSERPAQPATAGSPEESKPQSTHTKKVHYIATASLGNKPL